MKLFFLLMSEEKERKITKNLSQTETDEDIQKEGILIEHLTNKGPYLPSDGSKMFDVDLSQHECLYKLEPYFDKSANHTTIDFPKIYQKGYS